MKRDLPSLVIMLVLLALVACQTPSAPAAPAVEEADSASVQVQDTVAAQPVSVLMPAKLMTSVPISAHQTLADGVQVEVTASLDSSTFVMAAEETKSMVIRNDGQHRPLVHRRT
jgi:hypothetical protein